MIWIDQNLKHRWKTSTLLVLFYFIQSEWNVWNKACSKINCGKSDVSSYVFPNYPYSFIESEAGYAFIDVITVRFTYRIGNRNILYHWFQLIYSNVAIPFKINVTTKRKNVSKAYHKKRQNRGFFYLKNPILQY